MKKSILYISYLNPNKSKVAINQAHNTIYSLSKLFSITYVSHLSHKKLIQNIKNCGLKLKFKSISCFTFKTNNFLIEQFNRFIYSLFSLIHSKINPPDYIYTRDFSFIYFLSFLPKFLRPKCKIIFESHKVFHKTSKIVNINQEKRAYDTVDYFVSTTNNCKRDLNHLFGINKSKIIVTPNGVNLTHFNKTHFNKKKKVLKKYNLNENDKILIYSGSFLWWKGVDNLIKSLKYIKSKNTKLLLVGGEDLNIEKMKKLVKKEKLNKKIKFTGYLNQSDMINLLHCSSVGIIPNNKSEEGTRYTSPVKLYEYMACGLPMIISDLPSMREIVKENRNCIFFKPENEKDLARKIDLLIKRKDLARLLSRNNLIDVKKYTWDKKARKISGFLGRR